MIIYYNNKFNIDLGLLNYLHPFDGMKFRKVFDDIHTLPGIQIKSPESSISQTEINEFVNSLISKLITSKRYILRALELPQIPLLPFSVIDTRILSPMRWGVAATLEATGHALNGNNCWNLAGGYHHASAASCEGFCIYNDIGISVNQLRKSSVLSPGDKILIIDIDAHHGNGNAYTFLKDNSVTLFDIYNNNIYPQDAFSKERVNIGIPLKSGVSGNEYLNKLNEGLNRLTSGYKVAYVIAGTDVLASDPLGGMTLTMDECLSRDKMVFEKLKSLSIPAVFLGGGGYSKESAAAISNSIKELYKE